MTLLVILSKNMCSKHSYVYGETLHYARNTSNKEDFLLKVNSFSEKLTTRGYKAVEIATITQWESITQ